MVYPMMVAVDFTSLRRVHERPKGLIITLAVNWLIKPFTMAALGVLFFDYVFAPFIDPADGGPVHRGPDPARGRPLHRDGLRLVADDQG